MLVLVTILGNTFVAGKYEHMVVSGSALCWRRWRKRWSTAQTGFLCLGSVASMVVDSDRALFFCMSRKRMNTRSWRKTLVGAS